MQIANNFKHDIKGFDSAHAAVTPEALNRREMSLEIAAGLVRQGLPIAIVSKDTGLSLQQVKEMRARVM